jgi:hypothetical protein
MEAHMNGERPYEITHLGPKLHEVFDGLIPEAASGTPDEKEKNFLSRALAAFAIHKLAGCTPEEAAASIVDGGGDCGIDAAHYSPTSNTLWLAQSKYMESGRGEPELGEASKFKDGIEQLLQGQFDAFRANAAWAARLPQIEQYFKVPALRVRAVLVYSGINRVSEDRVRMFEDLTRRFSQGDDYLVFMPFSLVSVHDWVSGADEDVGVAEVQLEILNPGWLREPYETIFGLVEIAAVAALQGQHGDKLVAANIRRYKGETEVNEQIIATLRNEPNNFFYLNNGLTAYCTRLEVNHLDRANAEKKRVTARGMSIVNGAQTLGSVEASCDGNAAAAPAGFVFLKIISLERCEDDVAFARRITQSTNFQNQIGSRDFVALDDNQERIALQLQLDGVSYHYKDSEDTPASDDSNFTLDDATKALACLEQEGTCDLCARTLAHPTSLWSFEECYPAGALHRTRYHRLFRPDRSARTIWRAVQTRQAVIERLKTEGRTAVGVRKAFFENARSLVLNLVFLQLRPEQGEPLTLTAQEKTAISEKAFEIAEAMWKAASNLGFVSERRDSSGITTYEAARHPKSVFCSAADCQRLRNAALGILNGSGAAIAARQLSKEMRREQ